MGMLQKENKAIQTPTPRQVLESKFASARHNLLLVAAFTLINVILLATNSNTYFLFSAYIPYLLVDLGMAFCGMYPIEYYGGDLTGYVFMDKSFFVILLVIALVVLALYLLCWYLSQQNKAGWLIFALVFFSIDTALMLLLNGIAAESLIDIVFHVWVIYSLAAGIHANSKLKKLPEEPQESTATEITTEEEKETVIQDSTVLRYADESVKARVLLETESAGHKVIYRRVKRVNELVIDGRVYDEYTALVEMAHTLRACIGGHTIEAGYDGATNSFIAVDGQIVAKKFRIL